jgi:hypothetical protein
MERGSGQQPRPAPTQQQIRNERAERNGNSDREMILRSGDKWTVGTADLLLRFLQRAGDVCTNRARDGEALRWQGEYATD